MPLPSCEACGRQFIPSMKSMHDTKFFSSQNRLWIVIAMLWTCSWWWIVKKRHYAYRNRGYMGKICEIGRKKGRTCIWPCTCLFCWIKVIPQWRHTMCDIVPVSQYGFVCTSHFSSSYSDFLQRRLSSRNLNITKRQLSCQNGNQLW